MANRLQGRSEWRIYMENWIVFLFSGITSLATIVIAWYAAVSHRLMKTIKGRDDEFRQQLTDLYKAIVISTLLSRVPPGTTRDGLMRNSIPEFNKACYDEAEGKTPIFRETK
jgi:hypothetical protein